MPDGFKEFPQPKQIEVSGETRKKFSYSDVFTHFVSIF